MSTNTTPPRNIATVNAPSSTNNGTPDQDSDHDDHGSVVTYDEDEEVTRTKNNNTSAATLQAKSTSDALDIAKHPSSSDLVMSRCFNIRHYIGDICDTSAWETTFVGFTFVFIWLTLVEVSLMWGLIGSYEGLKGMSATSSALLALFSLEIVLKTIAYEMGFWRVPRNSLDSIMVLLSFALETASTFYVFNSPLASFSTEQILIASRFFRLLVCLTREKRIRELYVATKTMQLRGQDNLSTPQRALGILQEMKNKYPLSDVDQIQVQWCIEVIASHRLYTGFFQGPAGEPIRFRGVDDETAQWLLGTYSLQNEGQQTATAATTAASSTTSFGTAATSVAQSAPPPLLSPTGERLMINTNALTLASLSLVVPGSPKTMTRGVGSANDVKAVGGATSKLIRRETDNADALLTGRKHTALYLSPPTPGAQLTQASLGPSTLSGPVVTEVIASNSVVVSTMGAMATPERSSHGAQLHQESKDSPPMERPEVAAVGPAYSAHKRTQSRAEMGKIMSGAANAVRAGVGSKTHKRGGSFVGSPAVSMLNESLIDLEEGNMGPSIRVVTGSHFGTTQADLDYLDTRRHLKSGGSGAGGGGAAAAVGEDSIEVAPDDLDKMNRDFDEWSFDPFDWNRASHGFPLSTCLMSSLRKNGVFEAFGSFMSMPVVLNFCVEIESGYITKNPYHNRIHAADVVQCFHHLLTHRQFRDTCTPLDRLCGLVAAAVHDLCHPGVNNVFLVATRNKLAVQYNDISVLENMHAATAFEIMRANPETSDIFAGLPPTGRTEARETIIQMILATDMKLHFEVLSHFQNQVVQSAAPEKTMDHMGAWWLDLFPHEKDSSFSSSSSFGGGLTAYPIDYRRTILKTALHVSDVSNPARPQNITMQWASLVQEEFFIQGDLERAASLPISMFMDRNRPAFPKMQVGFIEFIVKPLMEAYWGWMKPFKAIAEPHLLGNLDYWKKRQEAETAAAAAAGITWSAPQPSPAAAAAAAAAANNKGNMLARLKIPGSTFVRSSGNLMDPMPPQQGDVSGIKRPTAMLRSTSDSVSLLVNDDGGGYSKSLLLSQGRLPSPTVGGQDSQTEPLKKSPWIQIGRKTPSPAAVPIQPDSPTSAIRRRDEKPRKSSGLIIVADMAAVAQKLPSKSDTVSPQLDVLGATVVNKDA